MISNIYDLDASIIGELARPCDTSLMCVWCIVCSNPTADIAGAT